jgi:hypothetical protein
MGNKDARKKGMKEPKTTQFCNTSKRFNSYFSSGEVIINGDYIRYVYEKAVSEHCSGT